MSKILPVFIPHGGCRHQCIFCDQKHITGEDHLPSESELLAMIPGDLPCDTELAFYGGSFTALPKSVRRGYLHFAREMKYRGRIRSIALSTHPSYVDESIMDELFFYDVDRIELGIQSTNAEVLAKAQRGHGRKRFLQPHRCFINQASNGVCS